MKRLFTIISALLITAGLKAQSSNAQKETSMPVADVNTTATAAKQAAIKKAAVIKKTDAAFKNTEIKKAAIKNVAFKNAEIKKAAVVADKAAPVKQ